MKCNKPGTACPFLRTQKARKLFNFKFTWKIDRKVNCNNYTVIYLIECNKDNCGQRYTGESKRLLRICIGRSPGICRQPPCWHCHCTGAHFTLPGNSVSNITFIWKRKFLIYQKQTIYFLRWPQQENARGEEKIYIVCHLDAFRGNGLLVKILLKSCKLLSNSFLLVITK